MDTGVRSTVDIQNRIDCTNTRNRGVCRVCLSRSEEGAETSGPVVSLRQGKASRIKLGGQTVGHENLKSRRPAAAGSPKAPRTSSRPTVAPRQSLRLTHACKATAPPISYDWSAQAEKRTARTSSSPNAVASITLEMQGARARSSRTHIQFAAHRRSGTTNLYHQ